MRNKVIGFLLALLPVLSIYVIPGIGFPLGLGTMYLIVTPLIMIGMKKKIRGSLFIDKYSVFVIYALIITILYKGAISNDLIGFVLNSICILILLRGGDYLNSFLKSYVYLAVAFSLFLILQYVSLLFFSYPINGIVSFLPTSSGGEISSLRAYDYIIATRISSVFMEPSHFALYSIPPVALLLWENVNVKYRIISLAIISTAILLSTSGNGLVLMLILYTLFYINKMKGKYVIPVIVIGLALIPVALKVSENVAAIQYTVNSLSGNVTSDNSKTYYRVNRGFLVYKDMPIYAQITGLGYRNSENFLMNYDDAIFKKYKDRDILFDYYNTIAAILIYFGVIGFVLMSVFICKIWKYAKHYDGKALLIVMVVSCISSSIFNTDTWFMYIVLMSAIIHGYFNKKNNNEKIRNLQNA